MLVLTAEVLRLVSAHAEEAYPHECCGLLLGPAGAPRWRATRTHRARNLDTVRAQDRYQMDPADRLAAEATARAADLAVVGFYHSHPDHEAYFSQTDLERSEERQWGEPWLPATYAYLVVSVREGAAGARRAFVVDGGATRELEVEVEVEVEVDGRGEGRGEEDASS